MVGRWSVDGRPTTYLPPTDQLPTTHRLTTYRPPTDRPPTDHPLTTYQPPTDHLPTTHRPPTDHPLTTYWPPTDHLPTTHRPPTDHLLTTYRPPTDHLPTTHWPPKVYKFLVHCARSSRGTSFVRAVTHLLQQFACDLGWDVSLLSLGCYGSSVNSSFLKKKTPATITITNLPRMPLSGYNQQPWRLGSSPRLGSLSWCSRQWPTNKAIKRWTTFPWNVSGKNLIVRFF